MPCDLGLGECHILHADICRGTLRPVQGLEDVAELVIWLLRQRQMRMLWVMLASHQLLLRMLVMWNVCDVMYKLPSCISNDVQD